ncbi:cinnamyl-alcohol dehydrogenase [Xylogone sp. PMI_703]|nr:cinnamyl-alcohol dehydrogenase [Xylogone sp. PMI_703]
MPGELVLITGVSGFIGYQTLVKALAANYHVRGTVRKSSQRDTITKSKSVVPYLKNLEILIVPDILTPGAFDEALKSVTYVIHVASPLAKPSEDPQTDIIEPAVKGTTNLLECVIKTSSVKRVVFTSSAVVSFTPGKETTEPITENTIVPRPSPPWGNFMEAYIKSKVLAFYATQDWMTTNNPSFDVINIMPSFVLGANKLITNAKEINSGTNSFMLNILFGHKSSHPLSGTSVHIDDVAFAHIKALDPTVAGNQSFLLSSSTDGIIWDDVIEIARKNFPVIIEKGLMPLDGTLETQKCMIDASKAEKQLGLKFKSYEEQVKSLVGYYLELIGEN